MRPQRAAAQAANAALASGASLNDDAEPSEQLPPVRKSRTRKAATEDDTYDPDKKPKASATTHFLLHSNYIPSVFDSLPSEIRGMIVECIPDALTLPSLSLVSKSWWAMLYLGKEAEKAWERRCNDLGQTKRARGAKTFALTFLRMMRRRCIVCNFEDSPRSLHAVGMLVAELPNWAKICAICCCYPGLLQLTSRDEASRCIPLCDLDSLPCVNGDIAQADVTKWLERYELDKAPKIDHMASLLADGSESAVHLRNIYDALTLPPIPADSERGLHKLARALLKADAPTEPDLQQLLTRNKETTEMRQEVEEMLKRLPPSPWKEKDPPLNSIPTGWRDSYLDLLVDKQITLGHYETYIARLRKTTGLARRILRLSKPVQAGRRCISGCSNFSIVACEQNRCEKHCPGPCAPHKREGPPVSALSTTSAVSDLEA